MYLQTSPEIKAQVPEMPRWGCHEMSLLRIVDYESGGNMTPEEIGQVHHWAMMKESILGPFDGVSTVLGPNCFVRDPNALLAYAFALQESKCRVYQIGNKVWESGVETFWGIDRKYGKAVDWEIIQWATKWGSHFTLATGQGDEIYNPDPTVPLMGIISTIYYQVRV